MSFVEKALNRLKQEEDDMRALGELQRVPQPAAAEPASATPEAPVTDKPTRPGMIVAVDRGRLREAGFLAPEKHERRMADEYRRIKRPLISNAFGVGVPELDDGNLVVVSSAISGEGKTHTCINLALSIAMERDRTVLLVDGDIPKPHISQLFGLTEQRGLLDVLADDKLEAESLVLRTDIPHLSVLPAGRWKDHATELLASGRMRSLCQALSHGQAGRIVLFDSPPLLAATEAQAIAAVAGQVVLVIAENVTARHDVEAALALLDEDKPVNAILNKSRRPMLGGYYYGGYGYGANAETEQ